MIKKNLCISACLLLVSTGIFAQDYAWTGLKQIKSVQVMNHGGFMINLEDEEASICSQKGSSTILIYPNQNGVTIAGAKSLLSTALIAFTTENKVNVMYSYSIDSGYCWGKVLFISK